MEPQESAETQEANEALATVVTTNTTTTSTSLVGPVQTYDDNWVKKDNVWTWKGDTKRTSSTSTNSYYVSRNYRHEEPVVPPIDCASFASLRQMLCYRRQGRTRTEKKFIHRFLAPLDMKVDGYGNYFKTIGIAPVMWACHTDSVHREGGTQRLAYETATGLICLGTKERSNCLGADDAAGVWLMTEMIQAGVEGVYVFHRDEESGAGGSRHFAKFGKHVYGHVNMCVSLDRYGYNSIITHQGGRCCSEAFAEGFAAALNKEHKMFAFKPDSTGLFTDSANYTENIAECTNLSVGYWGHHSSAEEVSVPHLLRLRDALCNVDMASLPIKRDPSVVDNDYGYGSYGGGWVSGKSYRYDKDTKRYTFDRDVYDQEPKSHGKELWEDEDTVALDGAETMYDMVADYPDEVVDLLEACGFDAKSLRLELMQRGVPEVDA